MIQVTQMNRQQVLNTLRDHVPVQHLADMKLGTYYGIDSHKLYDRYLGESGGRLLFLNRFGGSHVIFWDSVFRRFYRQTPTGNVGVDVLEQYSWTPDTAY